MLGPSGSGKSTLLRLLDRLAEPDEGTVRFRGSDVRELEPLELRRRAVLVPQLPAPLPGSVADNVRYGPGLVEREPDVARTSTWPASTRASPTATRRGCRWASSSG